MCGLDFHCFHFVFFLRRFESTQYCIATFLDPRAEGKRQTGRVFSIERLAQCTIRSWTWHLPNNESVRPLAFDEFLDHERPGPFRRRPRRSPAVHAHRGPGNHSQVLPEQSTKLRDGTRMRTPEKEQRQTKYRTSYLKRLHLNSCVQLA